MVRRLIQTKVHKYENIVKGAREMDIYALDQACADIDDTIEYIRKPIIKLLSIVERNMEIYRINKYERKIKEIKK